MRGLPPDLGTPLGPLALMLACGSEAADFAASTHSPVSEHAARWHWSDLGGLEVALLMTTFREEQELARRVDGAFGAVWSMTALRASDEVAIAVSLPAQGSPANGEWLEALEFETPEWYVTLGGPDDDVLGQRVEAGQLPPSWVGKLRPDTWDTGYGATGRSPGQLRWRLPSLQAGEHAEHHFAVAWCANDGDPDSEVAPWYAVGETTVESLRKASNA